MNKPILPRLFPLIPIQEFFLAFRYQYAVLAVIPFISGIIAANLSGQGRLFSALILPAFVLAAYLFAARQNGLNKKVLPWLLFLPLGFAAGWNAQNQSPNSGYRSFYGRDSAVIEGTVVTEPFSRNQLWNMELGDVSINGSPVKGDLQVKFAGDSITGYSYGDRIKTMGRIREPMGRRNPGAFDYAEYLANHGVYAVMSQYSAEKIAVSGKGEGNPVMRKIIIPLRQYIRGTVDRYVGPDGYLVIGILLGEKRDMPEEVLDDFRTTGLMHLLAVSGLNVGMLMLIFYQLFAALFVPHRMKIFLTLAVVWLYAAVTDLSPSVVRAAIMGSVILIGWALERKSFIQNSLAFSALLILVFRPLYLYDLGFILSYSATLSIIYVYPKWKKALPWSPRNVIAKSAVDSLLVSLAAMAGTIPIIAFSFNNFAPVSLIANLVAVPLSFVLLALGLLLAVFGPIHFLAAAYGTSAHYVTLLLNKSVALFAKVPFGYLIVGSPEGSQILFYFVILICVAELKDKRWARKGLVFALVLAACFYNVRALIVEKPLATVTFLDVGQGDCAVVELPGNETFLIDGGPKDRFVDSGARVVHPYLKYRGIRQLEGIFLSHADEDHIGGLFWIMEKVRIKRSFDSGLSGGRPDYQKFLQLMSEKSIPHSILIAGERVRVTDKVAFDVLHPSGDTAGLSVNGNSMVLRMTAGKFSVLFTGDADSLGEERIIRQIDSLRVDVIKVGHHGAETSSSTAFLQKALPAVAVISVGRFNRFGHPAPGTLARYKAEGARVFRMDESGAVILRIYKDSYRISSVVPGIPGVNCHR